MIILHHQSSTTKIAEVTFLNTPRMQTDTKDAKALALKKITNLYRTALFCYVFPFFFILLLIIDVNTFHATDALFLFVFLFSIFPLSIIGLAYNILGLRHSRKMNLVHKKNIGYTNLMLGIPMFIVGLLGLAVPFVMVLE